jgi:hypothetical protein
MTTSAVDVNCAHLDRLHHAQELALGEPREERHVRRARRA